MTRTINTRKLRFLIGAIISMMLITVHSYAQNRNISGTVTDASDSGPIPGVNVKLKGTSVGVSTDVNGKYTLPAKKGDILVFSAISYASQEIRVGDVSTVNVQLKSAVANLEEVVVIGYGVQKKKLTTGANLQVKGEELQRQNTTSALQALQGQAPGVQITSSSGQPGSAMNVIIRGKGTIGNNGPLYIVDGVQTSDISYLNPADIESMDVLKDAASAAIYGSQAANGVVLVTTKTGRTNQRTVVSFDAYVGAQQVVKPIRTLNLREYATIMNEAAINSGNNAFFTNAEIAAMGDGTNWIDEMFVKDAATQNYSFSAQGGGTSSIFSTSFSYTSQEGIVGGKDLSNYSRYNFRINSEHNLFKDKVKLGQHATFMYQNNNGVAVGGLYFNTLRGAFNTSPLLPMYDAGGNYAYNDFDWSPGESNPYASMVYNNQNRNNSQKLLGDIYLIVEPIKGLRYRGSFGIDYNTNEGRSYTPIYKLSIYSFSNNDKVTQSLGKGRSLIWDNLLSYKFDINKSHNFEALAGTSSFISRGTSMYGANLDLRFSGLDFAYLNNAENQEATSLTLQGYPWNEEKRMSYFGRFNYNFKETYLLNATFRADGSSRFAPGHRWGYFPSVSAGWLLSNESFLGATKQWLDYFKIRASWGQVGNQNIGFGQNIGFYQYLTPISYANVNYIFGSEEGELTRGAYPSRLGNPNVTWETSEQTNFGFDSRLLKGKLSFNLDYYIKNTKDWLILAPILATAGALPPYINGGDVKNSGLELALSYRSNAGAFNYNIGVNAAYNKNKIGNIPNSEGIIHGNSNTLFSNSPEFYRAANGMPIGYFWGLKTAGIFQNEAEVSGYRSANGTVIQPSAAPGDVKYVDLNGDGIISNLDMTKIGDPNPDYTFGLNLGFDYKGFDFYVLASGVAGNQLVQSYRNQTDNKANYTNAILGRWHGEGSSNTMPRVTMDNRNWLQFSDLYVKNGDYLRLNNVTLGYDLGRLIKKSYLSKARVYATVLNLHTFSKYDGMDPEIGYGESFSSGVDVGYYPRPRTIMFGTNITF